MSLYVLKVFGVLFIAQKSARWIHSMFEGSEDANARPPESRPGLALSVASCERALTLIADGLVDLESIEAARNGGHLINVGENPTTHKHNSSAVAFSEELWGGPVEGFLSNIKSIPRHQFNQIVSKATSQSQSKIRSIKDASRPSRALADRRNSRANIALNFGGCDSNDNGDDDDEDEDDEDDNDNDNDRKSRVEDAESKVDSMMVDEDLELNHHEDLEELGEFEHVAGNSDVQDQQLDNDDDLHMLVDGRDLTADEEDDAVASGEEVGVSVIVTFEHADNFQY